MVVIAHATTTFRQVPRSGLHLGCVHVLGMALAVKEDEVHDPVNVALLGAREVVFEADAFANLRLELYCHLTECVSCVQFGHEQS